MSDPERVTYQTSTTVIATLVALGFYALKPSTQPQRYIWRHEKHGWVIVHTPPSLSSAFAGYTIIRGVFQPASEWKAEWGEQQSRHTYLHDEVLPIVLDYMQEVTHAAP